MKRLLLGLAIAIAGVVTLFLPLALGLMAGFPFALWMDEELEPVGARATFKESADCLFQYRFYSAERELGARLNSEEVAFCFPPQTAAKESLCDSAGARSSLRLLPASATAQEASATWLCI